jgi:hypothetical protein
MTTRFVWFAALTMGYSCLLSAEQVTNPARKDGFGAQLQSVIYSMIFAELTGNEFLYTPFAEMEHNYHDDQQFLEKKEWLINLLGHVPVTNNTTYARPLRPQEWTKFVESHMHLVPECLTLKHLQGLFRANKNRGDYLDPDRFHIAVHIRRPNPHDCRLYGSHIPDIVFQFGIQKLREKYADKRPQIHIFSQGDEELFRSLYPESDVVLHIDEALEQTFPRMVFADVLVLSPSSLSWVAGLLSQGTVYYQPFWHRPLPTWIRMPAPCWGETPTSLTRDAV